MSHSESFDTDRFLFLATLSTYSLSDELSHFFKANLSALLSESTENFVVEVILRLGIVLGRAIFVEDNLEDLFTFFLEEEVVSRQGTLRLVLGLLLGGAFGGGDGDLVGGLCVGFFLDGNHCFESF